MKKSLTPTNQLLIEVLSDNEEEKERSKYYYFAIIDLKDNYLEVIKERIRLCKEITKETSHAVTDYFALRFKEKDVRIIYYKTTFDRFLDLFGEKRYSFVEATEEELQKLSLIKGIKMIKSGFYYKDFIFEGIIPQKKGKDIRYSTFYIKYEEYFLL